MKFLSLLVAFYLVHPASFANNNTTVAIPSKVWTLSCTGENRVLVLEWDGTPFAANVTIDGVVEPREGLRYTKDFSTGTVTYSKENVFSIDLDNGDEKKAQPFTKEVTLANKKIAMLCKLSAGMKVQE